jgi:hypothetical protein
MQFVTISRCEPVDVQIYLSPGFGGLHRCFEMLSQGRFTAGGARIQRSLTLLNLDTGGANVN